MEDEQEDAIIDKEIYERIYRTSDPEQDMEKFEELFSEFLANESEDNDPELVFKVRAATMANYEIHLKGEINNLFEKFKQYIDNLIHLVNTKSISTKTTRLTNTTKLNNLAIARRYLEFIIFKYFNGEEPCIQEFLEVALDIEKSAFGDYYKSFFFFLLYFFLT